MAEALREGQKRRVVRSDINANETATFLIAVGGVRRFGEKFAGPADDAIRPKKGELPLGVATPDTTPHASDRPRIAAFCLIP